MTAETGALLEAYRMVGYAMSPIECYPAYLFHHGAIQQPDSGSPSC